ncbi:hypothetical protein [Aestuariivirga sp.]|uniref:hypothetical protein n=1 Tax=Aestuariivirga sp. TaxID=2650926 RepID=UPI0039E26DC9
MDIQLAKSAKEKCLLAIAQLHSILAEENAWDEPNLRELKRGIGLAIGSIEVDTLSVIYAKFPELDDLK